MSPAPKEARMDSKPVHPSDLPYDRASRELAFRRWYEPKAKRRGLPLDPDLQGLDYRAAYHRGLPFDEAKPRKRSDLLTKRKK